MYVINQDLANCLKNDDELEKYASELGIDLINLNTDSARAKYITKIKDLYNTLNNNIKYQN